MMTRHVSTVMHPDRSIELTQPKAKLFNRPCKKLGLKSPSPSKITIKKLIENKCSLHKPACRHLNATMLIDMKLHHIVPIAHTIISIPDAKSGAEIGHVVSL